MDFLCSGIGSFCFKRSQMHMHTREGTHAHTCPQTRPAIRNCCIGESLITSDHDKISSFLCFFHFIRPPSPSCLLPIIFHFICYMIYNYYNMLQLGMYIYSQFDFFLDKGEQNNISKVGGGTTVLDRKIVAELLEIIHFSVYRA